MSSLGTCCLYAALARGEKSRADSSMPISFSTCTMTTVFSRLSVALRCSMSLQKARLSACSTLSEKQEAISRGLPVSVRLRGKRLVSVLNHAGA